MQLLVIIVLDACIASCVIVFSLISKRVADISFVLLMLSLGFSGYVILVYTDILSLPFSFVSIYAGLKIFRITLSNENKSLNRDDCMRVCMYGLLLGCASFFGYQMKASSIIPVIAFIVTISVSLWHKQVKKAFISLLLAVAVGFSVCAPIFHFAVNNQMKLNYDDSYSYPMSHFMAMGMRNRGGFSFEDRVDVDRYASKSEKNEYSLSLVERRLKDYGISGYSAFLLRKMYYTYSDGSFTFGQQDSSFEYVEPSNGSMFRNFRRSSVAEYVRSLYTVSSNSSAVIKMLSQFMIAILAFGILFFSFYALKKSLNAERSLYLRRLLLWLILALLGSFAFLMLFESGRSKYLIQFLPIYVLMASIGLNAFQIQLRKHMEK